MITGAFLLAYVSKGDDVLFINSFHCPFFDSLFYYGTTLGNGLLYLIVAVALAWKNFRQSVIALISFSVTGILIQFLKKVVFAEVMRPSVVLAGEPVHFVEGIRILSQYSFPSGHTAVAFSMFSLLSLMVKEKRWGVIFFIMALIGGVSRIYLAQHFFIDVYFGGILGVMVTSLMWWLFEEKEILREWKDKSISSYLKNS